MADESKSEIAQLAIIILFESLHDEHDKRAETYKPPYHFRSWSLAWIASSIQVRCSLKLVKAAKKINVVWLLPTRSVEESSSLWVLSISTQM